MQLHAAKSHPAIHSDIVVLRFAGSGTMHVGMALCI